MRFYIIYPTLLLFIFNACSISRKTYSPKNGIYRGFLISYNPLNNKTDTVYSYEVTFRNDTLHGPCRMSVGVQGLQDVEHEYAEEVKNQPGSTTGNYVNGVKDGTWQHFDKEGNLTQMEEYSSGLLHGHFIRWGEKKYGGTLNDTIVFETYKFGVKHGRVFWRSIGYCAYELNYENGRLHGHQKICREGEFGFIEKATFQNGALFRFSTTDTLSAPKMDLDSTCSGMVTVSRYSFAFQLLGKLTGSQEDNYCFHQSTDDLFSGVLQLTNGFIADGKFTMQSDLTKTTHHFEFVNGRLKIEH